MNFSLLFRFYFGLIFLYFSDMTLLMAVMWLSYEITQSSLFLSVMLTFSAILPLVLQRLKCRLNLLALALPQLMKLRIVTYLALSLVVLLLGKTAIGLIIFALLVGLLSITILSSYEARNTQLVLENQIDKSLSARIMQTMIQVGAFGGAMLGSIMLKQLEFELTVWVVSLLDISVCGLLFYFEPKSATVEQAKHSHLSIEKSKKIRVYIISGLLGLIALHISTFNLSVPIIFQTINQWHITDFGLASGMAGLGAFCAVFFKHSDQRYKSLLLLLFLADILFTFNKIALLITPLCFIIGFCMNSIRIAVREKLISLADNHQQAVYISGMSATYYLLFQSCGTLLLGGVIGLFPFDYFVQSLLPFIALCLLISFSLFYFKE